MKELAVRKEKIVLYDVIRFIAIILVLIGHSTYLNVISNYGGIEYKRYNNFKTI